jgi:hypothetical protein
MSAVLSQPTVPQGDVNARLAFQKQLHSVTNKIHATNNIDEIMLEVSADICMLFNADRLTVYSMGEDKQSIVSKVKTGLNSFKDLKLPIAEHSIAGYVALSRKMINIRDCYDDAELKSINPNLRFLQEVDKRTGYRTKQQLVAPILDQPSGELIGVIQIINNKAGIPFGPLTEEGVSELSQTLSIAFKQRQKPQQVKTKYDYLISDAIMSAGEFELASRQARKKAVEIETVLTDEFQVKLQSIGEALSKFFGVPYEPFKADRIKPMDLLKNLKREYVESNGWVPVDDAKEGLSILCLDPDVAHRGERVPEGEADLQGHHAEGLQGNLQPVLRCRGGGYLGRYRRHPVRDGGRVRRGDRLGQRRRLRRRRQRTREAREQDHHRRLPPGRVGHPHRALSGQGEDRDPVPA